jgi:hypothetical protein
MVDAISTNVEKTLLMQDILFDHVMRMVDGLEDQI